MNFLFVFALIAVARAELFESLVADEIDLAVHAVMDAEHSHISLRDLDDEERHLLVREIQTDLGATLERKLNETTQKLISAISKGKQNLMSMFLTFQRLITDLLEIGGSATDVIDQMAEHLKTTINTLKTEHLSPALKLIANFLQLFLNTGETELVTAYDGIEDEVVTEVVVRALQRRGIITDMFNKLIDTGKDILNSLLTGLHGKFKELGQFFVELTKAHIDAAKPHIENIKTLATEFLGHAKEATLQTLEEAKEFFGAYKDDLGALWTQLLNSIDRIENNLRTTTATPVF